MFLIYFRPRFLARRLSSTGLDNGGTPLATAKSSRRRRSCSTQIPPNKMHHHAKRDQDEQWIKELSLVAHLGCSLELSRLACN